MERKLIVKVSRRYCGSTSEERRTERREKLLRAAILVYGEKGFRLSTIQDVCTAAGLTKRYFYESFPDALALLTAALRRVIVVFVEELRNAPGVAVAAPSLRTRLILSAYYTALRKAPQIARLILMDSSGIDPTVDKVLHEAYGLLAELIVPISIGDREQPRPRIMLARLGAVGGMAQISIAWIAVGYDYPLDEVVEATAALFPNFCDEQCDDRVVSSAANIGGERL